MTLVAVATSALVLGSVALLGLGSGPAAGAVPDCATAANARTWDGPAAGSWGTAANWSGDVLPGPDEIACIGDATVTLSVTTEVDAVVSGPAGTLSMPSGFVLTLSPSADEQSQVANLTGPRLEIGGGGDMIVTRSFAWGGPSTLGGPAGSTLTLAASVGSNATVGGGTLNGRTLVIEDGVTVTQSAGIGGSNGGSVENGGIWLVTGDVSLLSGVAPSVFRNTPSGILRKTGGAGNTTVGPVDNDGLIENLSAGTIVLVSGGTSDGDIVTGPGGTVQFQAPGSYAVAGDVTGDGTVRVVAEVTFSGTYSPLRTEIQGGGAAAVFDTPSPQVLPQLVLSVSTRVAGSTDIVVTESFTLSTGRIDGQPGSRLTLAASVGTNATVSGGFLDGRTLVIEDGVTVTQPSGIINQSNGGSIVNSGIWLVTGDASPLFGSAPSMFHNTSTGILKKTGGTGVTQVGVPRVVNDGLIVNESGGTLGLGRFSGSAPGQIAIGDVVSGGPVVTGTGRLAPAVRHSFGIVSPGSSPGTIEVTGAPGSWEAGSSAGDPPTLQIEIGGTGPGEFDKLILPGAFTLPPGFTTLALSTLPGYEPTPGDEFAIVDAGSVSGTFDTVTGTDLGNGLSFEVTYEADRIIVTVNGTPLNGRPDTVDDDLTVAEDSGATPVDVLANDTDPESEPLEIVSSTQPANGSVTCTASECAYTPDPDFNGADSFTYRIADPIGNTDTATVTVDVAPVNDDPSASDDAATIDQGSAANDLDVLGNDDDVDGDGLQVTAVSDPANGGAQISPGGGSVFYTPDPGFSGADSFTYTVSDGNGGEATATVSVTVTAPQTGTIEVVLEAQPDDAQDFTFIVSVAGQQLEAFSLDDDTDGTLPSSRLLGPLAAGTEYTIVLTGALPAGWALTAIDCDGNPGDLLAQGVAVQLEPDDTIRCTFTVGTGFIEVALDAQPDDAQDFPFVVSTGGQQVDAFSLDDDGDGDGTLAASRRLGPLAAGTEHTIVLTGALPPGWTLIAIDCDGTPGDVLAQEVVVDLDPGDTVRCTFTVGTGFIEVALDAQPDGAQDFALVVSRLGQDPAHFSLDDDVDGELPASQLIGPLAPGGDQELYFVTLSLVPPGWTVTAIECSETPVSGGPQSAEVSIQLDPGDTIRCTFTIVTGFLDVALDSQPDDGQDVAFEIEELGTDGFFSLDDDSDPTLPAEMRSGPLEIDANGTIYRIRLDGGLEPGWRLIAISCSEAPVLTDLPFATVHVRLDPGETVRCTFTLGAGSLEVALDSQPDDSQDVPFNVSIAGEGEFSLDDDADPTLPAGRQFGPLPAESHSYTIRLGDGSSLGIPPNWSLTAIDCTEEPVETDLVRQEVIVELNPGDNVRCTFVVTRVTQNPVAVDDSATVDQDSAANPIDVLANDTDPDGDALTILSNGGAAHGTVSCTATLCSYTPNPGYSGPDSFTYTMSDGQGVADDGLVSITVLPVSGPGDEILFASARDGNLEIYVMSADGSDQRRLTVSPGLDDQPVWSPDRTRIAFRSNRSGSADIFVMNADGSGQTRLTTDSAMDLHPAWSPDGTKIAFESNRAGSGDVYVMNTDGSQQTRLTTSPEPEGRPMWSPDGTKIAFAGFRAAGTDIYVMDANGGGEVRVTRDPGNDVDPAWSPDGKQIAFMSNRGVNNHDVFVIGADGSEETRLTAGADLDQYPTWSPDGTRIAFVSYRSGAGDIYVMNADGSNQTRLTTSLGTDITPAWATPSSPPPPNRPPDAVDDRVAVPEGASGYPLDVLGNDTDPDGDRLAVVDIVSNESGGTVDCARTSCRYTPDPGFVGQGSFVYRVSDDSGAMDTATVTLTVGTPKTALTLPATRGSSVLEVPETEGFVGKVVQIGEGETAEKSRVKELGSLVLDKPLRFYHAAGEPVVVLADTLFVSVDHGRVDFRTRPAADTARFTGTLALAGGAAASCGEEVRFALGGGVLSQVVAGAHFTQAGADGPCVYRRRGREGPVEKLDIDLARGTWAVELARAGLDGLANPVEVALSVGLADGSESIGMRQAKTRWTYTR
jgi:Tol biopolymer transport system component